MATKEAWNWKRVTHVTTDGEDESKTRIYFINGRFITLSVPFETVSSNFEKYGA